MTQIKKCRLSIYFDSFFSLTWEILWREAFNWIADELLETQEDEDDEEEDDSVLTIHSVDTIVNSSILKMKEKDKDNKENGDTV